MKHNYIIPALFFLVVAFAGCMRDKADGCPPEENLILHFKYDGGSRALSEIMDYVVVYLFDRDDRFIYSTMVTAGELQDFQGVNISVDPGEYNVICWSNISFDIGSSSSRVDLPVVPLNGEAVYYAPRQSTPDPYGGVEYETFSVAVPSRGVAEETIEFMSAHRTVSVYIKGMTDRDVHGEELPPVVELTEVPSGYDFHFNLYVQTKKYRQTAAYSGEMAGTVFNTPFFRIDDNVEVVVRKQTDNSVLHSVNLQEFLLSEGIGLTVTEPVEIMIEFTDAGISITFPSWGDDYVKPEF